MSVIVKNGGKQILSIRSAVVDSIVKEIEVTEKKAVHINIALSQLRDVLNSAEVSMIYRRLQHLKAEVSVCAKNAEIIETTIIVSLLKE